MFGIWKFVPSPRVGGHPSLLGPILERRLTSSSEWPGLLKCCATGRSLFCVRRRGGVPCLSDVDSPNTFTARNAINDVI